MFDLLYYEFCFEFILILVYSYGCILNEWQVSCGCHHSALLTREGVLYMWGRNLDGQLGSGTRKEIPIPTPLTSAATSATSNTRVN